MSSDSVLALSPSLLLAGDFRSQMIHWLCGRSSAGPGTSAHSKSSIARGSGPYCLRDGVVTHLPSDYRMAPLDGCQGVKMITVLLVSSKQWVASVTTQEMVDHDASWGGPVSGDFAGDLDRLFFLAIALSCLSIVASP